MSLTLRAVSLLTVEKAGGTFWRHLPKLNPILMHEMSLGWASTEISLKKK